jgi:hypothetical protein
MFALRIKIIVNRTSDEGKITKVWTALHLSFLKIVSETSDWLSIHYCCSISEAALILAPKSQSSSAALRPPVARSA